MDAVSSSLVVMYHSISSSDYPSVLGSFPITMDRFKYQVLSAIELGYKIGRLSDLFKNKKDSSSKYLYITGDDGTVDWTRNVLPWCEERGFYTHTALISGVWRNPAIYPLAHLVQIILETRNEVVLGELTQRLIDKYLSATQLDYINTVYQYEQIKHRRVIKGAFNLVLPTADAYTLIGELSTRELDLLHQRFESFDFYRKLSYAEVGVHTVTHQALDVDIANYLATEIDACENDLLSAGLRLSGFFVSPMTPKYGASLNDLITPLKERAYLGILDHGGIWDQESYIVKRIDAKQLERTINIAEFTY